MNKNQNEDNQLARVRNVGMDVQAIMHMTQSYKSGEREWTCQCPACSYVRRSPQVADAFAKAVVRNYSK